MQNKSLKIIVYILNGFRSSKKYTSNSPILVILLIIEALLGFPSFVKGGRLLY